jgi:hypothetical protein
MKPTYSAFVLAVLAAYSLYISPLRHVAAQTNDRSMQVKSALTSERRVALVIGNSTYKDSPLLNPVNDARDMARTLNGLGFEVIYGENLSQNDMKRNIRAFGDQIRNGGVGLFYYAGHGTQINGVNYLIPVDATITKEEEVEYESVEVDLVLAQMRSARNHLNIVILDACRNNPFARSFRSVNKGLASIDAPGGTLIAYATGPGSVASDGEGRNGLYTMELLNAIRVPGIKIEDLFKRVRSAVLAKTAGKQLTWESTSLVGDFYFSERSGPDKAMAAISLKSLKKLDRTDPKITATAILQAYKARDIVVLSELSNSRNRLILSEMVRDGERNPRFDSFFSGWRWDGVQKWQGQLNEVRYKQTRSADVNYLTARVKFGEIGPEEVLVVTMILEDGKWCFEDFHSPNRGNFEAESKVKPIQD